MKFDGKKHIDTSMYSKIKITENNGEIKVKAELDKKFENLQPDKISRPSLTDKIKDLSDEEKVKELVEYFLRNNTIYKIKQDDNAVVVYGTSERQLKLSLSHKYSDLIKLIIAKYTEDRVKQIDEIDADKIIFHLDSTITSYNIERVIEENDEEELILHLNLLKKSNGEVINFDSDFVDNYINEFINNNQDMIKFIRCYDKNQFGFVGKNIKISFPNDDFYRKYVQNAYYHNQDIYDDEENQLVLEFAKDSMPKKHVFEFYFEK